MDTDPRSLPRLLSDTIDQFVKLLRSELAVARAELSEKVSQAVSGAAMLAVAGILLIPVAVILLLGLTAWLIELGMRPSLAHLSAGVGGFVIVSILAFLGKTRVTPANLAPTRTMDEIRRDREAAREIL